MANQNDRDDFPPILKIPLSQKERFERICRVFTSKFGSNPSFYARAPGRVNIIGEHIDYCGYSVLPMAIEQDIVMAASPNTTGQIIILNTDPQFPEFCTDINKVEIDKSSVRWYNYFLCGFRGIIESQKLDKPVGLNLVIDGTVPKSAGLSSSSAFVCCAGLVTMQANGLQLSKLILADICTWCERYIGTQGGGMDQSISFLAERGTAKHIEFNPLKASDVKLPEGVVFVITNSCVEMQKAATSNYNIRVVECRLAAQVIAKSKGIEWTDIRKLGDLQKELKLSLSEMEELVDKELKVQPYLKSEVCEILGVSDGELNQTSLSENTLHISTFKLHDRAKHVYSEANRVLQFHDICQDSPDGAIKLLGKLMNDSHASCRDLYECSCPELDELTQLCLKSGALGSRLTGAGWGGCAVSMVRGHRVADFLGKVYDGYYANDPQRKARVKESLFTTQPGSGAAIYIP
ncbi:N-acetylgalactosamine kinase-like [Glandiceps talaboti]